MARAIRDKPAVKAGETEMLSDPRPCERECIECKQWLHHSRFRFWKNLRCSTESQIRFSPRCKACEQKIRNLKKNADRPKAIIESRARAAATKAGESFDFFWTQMNYVGLVPYLRVLMSDEGTCLGCGHKFVNERDIQIEHTAPPRSRQDWARLHTRNLRFTCGSCNGGKSNKEFEHWLDEQEDARISNLKEPTLPPLPTNSPLRQMSLF